MTMNKEPIRVPVFFSGEAEAHGLRQRDPTPHAGVVEWLQHEWVADDGGYLQADLKIIESPTDPSNVGLVTRVFIRVPQQGMSDGQIKAREAELKALKIAFAPESEQEKMAAKVNPMRAAVDFTFDFAGKRACWWFEPGNPDAPRGKENKNHPDYNKGFSYVRWLARATFNKVVSGEFPVGLRNTPLKGAQQPAATGVANLGFTPGQVTPPGQFTTPQPPGAIPPSGVSWNGSQPTGGPAAPATPATQDGAAQML